jgi:energy-converting hydrogenase Eha subunit C
MLIEPYLEGRNAHDASPFQIYFNDPFLAYAYIGSIPFFVALIQVFKLLGYIGQNKVFSQAAVNTLKTIKYCAFITAGAIVAADVYLKVAAYSSNDDPAGAVMLGMIAAFVSIVIGIAAAVFEKILQSAVDIKSENDLTV